MLLQHREVDVQIKAEWGKRPRRCSLFAAAQRVESPKPTGAHTLVYGQLIL